MSKRPLEVLEDLPKDENGENAKVNDDKNEEVPAEEPYKKAGVAWIKTPYILPRKPVENVVATKGEPAEKKTKVSRGRNKNRPIEKGPPAKEKICPSILKQRTCNYGDKCKFCHNVSEFMAKKPPDLGETCYVFEKFGKCSQGISCRYGSRHIDVNFENIVNNELYEQMSKTPSTVNFLDKETQKLLWKKKYDFTKANGNVQQVKFWYEKRKAQREKKQSEMAQKNEDVEVAESVEQSDFNVSEVAHVDKTPQSCEVTDSQPTHGCVTDEDLIKIRPVEKKKINFSHKLYLAPLTTVGNLPFRRICKTFGADITCSEMAVATNLLQANQSEWALIKRHHTEDIFGVQVCGAYPDTLTRCAQLLTEVANIDFLDINCGCPIDLVYKRGEGSALMAKTNKLEQIVKSMTSVMNVPLTIKMRTGISSDKHIAHHLVPKLRDWGVSQVTIHGRSREQRYTRMADWEYINQCAEIASPMPVFGNGDILSYEEYHGHLKNSSVNGIMIARGALIKPWIFTEIKESRHWDISANERFDMLKDFVNYGLEHWGSDHQGVENVRRFLLEQLSFSYRYIPVGLLERLPQKINERPPAYQGRSDLETLLSSPNCADWIKISEMLLGPVPHDFTFLPKHRANSYN